MFWRAWNIELLRYKGVAEFMGQDWKGIGAQGLWGPLALILHARVSLKLEGPTLGGGTVVSYGVGEGGTFLPVFWLYDLGPPSCLWLPTHPPTYPLHSGISPCFLLVVSPNLNTLFLLLSGKSC